MRGISKVAVLAAVVAIGATTTVWAAIPAGDGTISGCYAKKGGKLRVIDAAKKKCRKKERTLKWSQTGPAGPAGTPGARGPAGPRGPKGDPGTPSVAYSTVGFEILDADGLVLGELDLPAGRYLLLGTGIASNGGTDAGEVQCDVGSSQGDIFGEILQTVPAEAYATFTAQSAIELSAAATVEVSCVDAAATDAVDLSLVLTAVPVGRVIDQF